ncbi:MAG: serine/threonine protein kinase [Cyanobacteria bacterium REEB67]|nr:serine/threonine protein kinase [Cyanobacteria bacterium REEB67]
MTIFTNAGSNRKQCPQCHLVFIGDVQTCPCDGSVLAYTSLVSYDAEVVPGYRLEREVGSGGSAKVYKAVCLQTHEPVAVKILHEWHVDDLDQVEHFNKEAELTSRLSSRHTINVKDFGTLPDLRPYMVMDYIDGQPLSSFIENEPVSADWALPIFVQIAWGLAHCHALGIVHCDIKPSNILLSEQGDDRNVVKIVDFGIAKSVHDLNGTGSPEGETRGSPLYMSPEQCMGRVLDNRSDIYSLGCLMYEMLTGRPVFFAAEAVAVMKKHVYETPMPFFLSPNEGAAGLEKIVLKAISKKVGDRYQDISRLQIDLQRCLASMRSQQAVERRRRMQVVQPLYAVPAVSAVQAVPPAEAVRPIVA